MLVLSTVVHVVAVSFSIVCPTGFIGRIMKLFIDIMMFSFRSYGIPKG